MTIKTPELVTLWWLERELDKEPEFANEALTLVQRLEEQEPDFLRSQYTPASSVSGLLSYFLENHILPSYIRGKQIDDYLKWVSQPAPSDGDPDRNYKAFWSSIQIKKDEFSEVLNRYGMPTPQWLLEDQKNDQSLGTSSSSELKPSSELTAQYADQSEEKLMAGSFTIDSLDRPSQNQTEKWELIKPERFDALTDMIYAVLKDAHGANKPRPTAREVISLCKKKFPAGVLETNSEGIKFINNKGDEDAVTIESVRKRIERLTK